MGYEFDSSACHNRNNIGEEGNGKPPHKPSFPRKTQSRFSGFCNALNRVCNAVNKYIVKLVHLIQTSLEMLL